jgi:glucose-6-phosphate 1-dehydrogenase
MLSAPHPFSLILFGASGHLASIKLYPALYILALKKRLPENFAIVGYSRSDFDDTSFRKLVTDSVKEHMEAVNDKILEEFVSHFFYQQGTYDDLAAFQAMEKRIKELEKKWKDPVRLAYYSVPPGVYSSISEHLCESGIHSDALPVRTIVEKPVGGDLKSFESIKKKLLDSIGEENIYLLDHYLGKEAVRNVYYLRHANPILERLFKNTLISHVEITAAESSGLEGRAGYFDHTGTFRDMFQSHLLMIASLLTMRLIETDESFVHARADALKQFFLPPSSDLSDVALQAQYARGQVNGETVEGYLDEDDVSSDSRTNTYAALKLRSRTSRWDGVGFYLRSGKRMKLKETRISVAFQEPRKIGEGTTPNRLDVILQGEAGMRFHLQTKLGGEEPKFRPLLLSDPLVCFGDCLPEHGTLLLEAIHGKKQWFLTFEEVQLAWRLMDPIQTYFDQKSTPLPEYKAGSMGPDEADAWIGRDGISWFA